MVDPRASRSISVPGAGPLGTVSAPSCSSQPPAKPYKPFLNLLVAAAPPGSVPAGLPWRGRRSGGSQPDQKKIQVIQPSFRKPPTGSRRALGPLPRPKPGGPRKKCAIGVGNRLVPAGSRQPGQVFSGGLRSVRFELQSTCRTWRRLGMVGGASPDHPQSPLPRQP